MEIKIGIKESARELVISTDNNNVEKEITNMMEKENGLLNLTDTTGNNFLIPISRINYIVVGKDSKQKVGFTA